MLDLPRQDMASGILEHKGQIELFQDRIPIREQMGKAARANEHGAFHPVPGPLGFNVHAGHPFCLEVPVLQHDARNDHAAEPVPTNAPGQCAAS